MLFNCLSYIINIKWPYFFIYIQTLSMILKKTLKFLAHFLTLIFNYHIYIFHHSLIKFNSKFLFIHFAFPNICVFEMLYLWSRRDLTTLLWKIPPDAPLTSILCNHSFNLLFNKALYGRPCLSFCHSNLVTLFLIPSWLFFFSCYTGRQFIIVFLVPRFGVLTARYSVISCWSFIERYAAKF